LRSNLFLEGDDRFVVLPQPEVRAANLEPCRLVLRLEIEDPLDERQSLGEIAAEIAS
jgi:hypothetical protein